MDFKGSQFERHIILWVGRWYVAYPISYRQLEEMMQERGVEADHSSLNRWALKYTPGFCRKVWFFEQNRKIGHHKFNLFWFDSLWLAVASGSGQ